MPFERRNQRHHPHRHPSQPSQQLYEHPPPPPLLLLLLLLQSSPSPMGEVQPPQLPAVVVAGRSVWVSGAVLAPEQSVYAAQAQTAQQSRRRKRMRTMLSSRLRLRRRLS
jgi:hypothetical protein